MERILQEQKAFTRALLDENRHLVEALRDALMERHELIGREITDVLAAAEDGRRALEVDLRDTHVGTASTAGALVAPSTALPDVPAPGH